MPSPDAGAFPESPGAVGNRREQPAPDKPKSSEEFSSDEPVPTDNVEEMQHVTSGWKGWIIPIDLVEKGASGDVFTRFF